MALIDGQPLEESDLRILGKSIVESALQLEESGSSSSMEYAEINASDRSISDGGSYTSGTLSIGSSSAVLVLVNPEGSGLTVDVSVDGGSTFSITGKSPGELIDLTGVTGGDIVIRLNNSTGSSVSINGFGFMGWE